MVVLNSELPVVDGVRCVVGLSIFGCRAWLRLSFGEKPMSGKWLVVLMASAEAPGTGLNSLPTARR